MSIIIDKCTNKKSLIKLSNNDDDHTKMTSFNDKASESIAANDYLLTSTKNKVSKRSLRKSKYSFLCILILFVSGLVLLTSFIIYHHHLINQLKQSLEKYQRQTELINQLIHLQPIDNQTTQQRIQHLQQSSDQQKTDLTNELNKISAPTYQTNFHRSQLKSHVKWKQHAKTIAGGNGQGDHLDQLNSPQGTYVDYQQQSIYIADTNNHRIVKWKLGEDNGQIVAGGNSQGDRIDQLKLPFDVIVDQKNKSLIICDHGNKRVVRWSLENQHDKQILIDNIVCHGLMMNENGDLFVSDRWKNEVKRWRKSDKEGTVVAGGNGQGNQRNQLNCPTFIFIDRQDTVYVSDSDNHRVMKWMKNAKDGILVAGGRGKGNSLKELYDPHGLIVNEVGNVYVIDHYGNDRITCWPSGSKEGRLVLGETGSEEGSNQLSYPMGLSFDVENNLYVADQWNHRIQLFSIDKN